MTTAVLGVDAGGTKTAGVLATRDGGVIARAQGGTGNYHVTGLEAARDTYQGVLAPLLAAAAAEGLTIGHAAFGLSGLDRPVDAERLTGVARDLLPEGVGATVVNDTALILRAGTLDGVGVAVVSGTGSNCLGQGPDGRQARVGGFGHGFGDDGSAEDIGREGMRAVFQAEDGRGPQTALRELLITRYHLTRVDDLIDHFLMDAGEARLSMGIMAPLVFEAARGGDGPCQQILRDAGRALAHAAVVVAQQLFHTDAQLPLVLGGAVWQRALGDTMREAFITDVRAHFTGAAVSTLSGPPVMGAALLALDAIDRDAGRSEGVRQRLNDTLEVQG